MIAKRRPKWKKKRCDFATCDFSVFAKSITFKSFFYMSRGPNNYHNSVKNLCENGVGKRDAKSAQNIRDMYPRQRPKSYRNLQKRPKGGQRVRQEAPKVAWVAPKVCQRSLRPAYFLPTSLRSLSWSGPGHRFAPFWYNFEVFWQSFWEDFEGLRHHFVKILGALVYSLAA